MQASDLIGGSLKNQIRPAKPLVYFVHLLAFCSMPPAQGQRDAGTRDVPPGLRLNVHEIKRVDGLSRMILPGANPPRTEEKQVNEAGEVEDPDSIGGGSCAGPDRRRQENQ
jgi:hypothetical protein